MKDFTSALEAHAPTLMGAAWDFLDRRPEVELIWWYFGRDETVYTANPYFQINGQVLTTLGAAEQLGLETSVEAQIDLLRTRPTPSSRRPEPAKCPTASSCSSARRTRTSLPTSTTATCAQGSPTMSCSPCRQSNGAGSRGSETPGTHQPPCRAKAARDSGAF